MELENVFVIQFQVYERKFIYFQYNVKFHLDLEQNISNDSEIFYRPELEDHNIFSSIDVLKIYNKTIY